MVKVADIEDDGKVKRMRGVNRIRRMRRVTKMRRIRKCNLLAVAGMMLAAVGVGVVNVGAAEWSDTGNAGNAGDGGSGRMVETGSIQNSQNLSGGG